MNRYLFDFFCCNVWLVDSGSIPSSRASYWSKKWNAQIHSDSAQLEKEWKDRGVS